MLEGKTKSGFAFCVDENRINNMEYIECVAVVENDLSVLPRMLTLLLGDEQKRALYDHVRTEDGRVPIDAIEKEFYDIMSGNEELKNS